jgi:NADH dehydrogenase
MHQILTSQTEVKARSSAKRRPRVVVVGAGFGGLSAVRELRRAPVDVLLLDRNNYHGFWPLLYQAATGILEPQQIAYPVRAMLRKQGNVDFRMAEVRRIDLEARRVLTDGGAYAYDYLVLAGGSATDYFGNDGLAGHAYSLKDIDDADRLRNHVLTAFEAAAVTDDPGLRAALLTFVIVGGGPTGVELAGQLALLTHRTLRRDFASVDLEQTRVVLVNRGDSVLESFREPLRHDTRRRLEKMGVELRLGQTVESVERGTVRFADGSRLAATTVVWAAGVRAADLASTLDAPVAQAGRVVVTSHLNLESRPEVFVVGDMAYHEGYAGDRPYPMVAQVAIQQRRRASRNITALNRGRAPRSFRYFDKGQMAIIDRHFAVVDGFGLRLRGRLAWIAWLALHLINLQGIKNRLAVLLDWMAVYSSRTPGAGIITRTDGRRQADKAQPHVPDTQRKLAPTGLAKQSVTVGATD